MKMGLGAVALMAVCCGGPLVLSVLASGALLGAAAAVWAGARPWLLAGGAVLVVTAVWLLRRRLIGGRAHCNVPPRTDADSG